MTYRGYTAHVVFDPLANVLHGEVLGLRDVVTFEATSVEGTWAEFRASVDDYLAWCAERGVEPEKPYSGRYLVRMDPRLHRDVAVAAEAAGQSMNAFIVACLVEAVDRTREPSDDIAWAPKPARQ